MLASSPNAFEILARQGFRRGEAASQKVARSSEHRRKALSGVTGGRSRARKNATPPDFEEPTEVSARRSEKGFSSPYAARPVLRTSTRRCTTRRGGVVQRRAQDFGRAKRGDASRGGGGRRKSAKSGQSGRSRRACGRVGVRDEGAQSGASAARVREVGGARTGGRCSSGVRALPTEATRVSGRRVGG